MSNQFIIPPDSAATSVPNEDKVLNKLFANRNLPNGTLVAVRRNLNSKMLMSDGSIEKLQTVHDTRNPEKGWDGDVLGYDTAVTVTNAVFGVNQEGRRDIALRKQNKFPMAAVVGRIKQGANSTEGVMIFFNPRTTHLFVDSDGYAVRAADEVTIFADRTFARGNIYYYGDEAPQPLGGAESFAQIKRNPYYRKHHSTMNTFTLSPTGSLADTKDNPRGRHTVQTPRRWYWVNHENGVVVGPMPRARAVRMMEDANLNYSADTTAVSEPTMLRDYNGGHYKAPVKYSKSKDDTAKRNPYYGRTPKWRREEQSDMPPQFLTYEQDIKRLQGLADDAWNDGNIQGSNRYSQLLWDKHGIVYPYDFKPVKEVKPNGFKHARPFGGSVGREQYHVHFEDAKGVIFYYAGNTDRGVKLEREYTKAKKFTKQKAAALAKKLDRLYKNVRHDGGHFYAESAGDVKANGERGRYTTYAAWRAACRKIDRNFRVEGDKDIASAVTADGRWIGEWDGAVGTVEIHKTVKANPPFRYAAKHSKDYYEMMSEDALLSMLRRVDPNGYETLNDEGTATRADIIEALRYIDKTSS